MLHSANSGSPHKLPTTSGCLRSEKDALGRHSLGQRPTVCSGDVAARSRTDDPLGIPEGNRVLARCVSLSLVRGFLRTAGGSDCRGAGSLEGGGKGAAIVRLSL